MTPEARMFFCLRKSDKNNKNQEKKITKKKEHIKLKGTTGYYMY